MNPSPPNERGGSCQRLRWAACALATLSHGDDPRLNPEVPRSTPLWKTLYALRTCTERFFSLAKSVGGLARRAFRRKHLFHIFATLHALGVHARARLKKRLGALPRTTEERLEALRVLLASDAAIGTP